MSDACGCGDDEPRVEGAEEKREPERLWQVSELRVRVGDLLLVRPGERLATDGVIRSGRTALGVSALTGESVPVEFTPGDAVYAGSINGTGAIEVQVAVVAAIGAASRIGALVKGGAALEALGRIRAVALDKTGTLTRNEPTVVDIATVGDASREQVLQVAAALESRSEHPLRTILAAVPEHTPAVDAEAVTGAGLASDVDGQQARLGWIDPDPLGEHVTAMQTAGATAVLVEHDGVLLDAIAVRDELRPEAAEVVARLHADGYSVAILTGDNARTASALAAQATADVGIAMGAMGTDVAIETVDVAFMGEDLQHLPYTLAHARQSRRIMLQNVGLSLGLITVLIPLATFGVLGLAAVVLVHELAEIVVIGNGVRASRTRTLPTTHPVTPEGAQ